MYGKGTSPFLNFLWAENSVGRKTLDRKEAAA
jgi:hypothetical protein